MVLQLTQKRKLFYDHGLFKADAFAQILLSLMFDQSIMITTIFTFVSSRLRTQYLKLERFRYDSFQKVPAVAA